MARRLAVVLLLVVGVTLIILSGAHNLRQRQLVIQKAQQNEVALAPADSSGASGDSASDPLAATMLGKVAPAFSLVDLNGKKVSLADYKGHPIVLNFWATYCGPCKLEMPWFQQLAGKYQAQGLVVLGIDQDDGMASKDVGAASKQIGVSYPILIPDGKVSKDYQLSDYLPETYYVGKDGKIVDQTIGAHSKNELEADIQKAIGASGL